MNRQGISRVHYHLLVLHLVFKKAIYKRNRPIKDTRRIVAAITEPSSVARMAMWQLLMSSLTCKPSDRPISPSKPSAF